MPGPAEIAVLSNSGPLSFVHDDAGGLVARKGAGGLVAALGPGVEHSGSLWLAAALSDADREAASAGVIEAQGFKLRSLLIDERRYRAYYDVVANGTLWFLHHGL